MKTILVVDDEFSIVDAVCEILAWEGYRAVGAENGKAGLVAMAQERPDLVLLDFMMPVMDGVQMLHAMRQHPEYRHIPVIMVTAAPQGLPRGEPLWNALLPKPFEIEQLLKTVREQLREPVPGK
jgi:CheY-like chemotaxis protein